MKEEGNMNILLLSVGTRNKIVQFFKQELGESGRVICTDMSELAPALYEGDKYYITPAISDENYLNTVLNICRQEKVSAVLSLIDPELSLLAKNKSLFEDIGVTVLVSDYELVEMSFNKWQFYKKVLEYGFKSQRTIIDDGHVADHIEAGELTFPVFVKPRHGSASLNISKIEDIGALNQILTHREDYIIQEFIDGTEYGIDVYIDMVTREVISIFIKQKIKMRAGETDKAIAVKNEDIFKLVEAFVKKIGYVGVIDIDLFERNGMYYISEVNPRFGGGYPHAYLAGCNFPRYIINNLLGQANPKTIGDYQAGSKMMKYNEVYFKE